MREAKVRTIYDNYDIEGTYMEEAKEDLKNNGIELTEANLYESIRDLDKTVWEDVWETLSNFFNDGSHWVAYGKLGLWNGNHFVGLVFEKFDEFFYRASKGCDFVRIYDCNGLLYVECVHHDGTNVFKIKKLTDKGITYYNNQVYKMGGANLPVSVYNNLMLNYSTLPHFGYTCYGFPKVEYNKTTSNKV